MNRRKLGQELRNYRITSHINQAKLADLLSVSQSQISRWESGRDTPRAENAAAIEILVLGRPDPHLTALIQFVEISRAKLALFNHRHELLAASRQLTQRDGPLQTHGWVLDPRQNPAFAPLFQRYFNLLQQPEGELGLELKVPFTHLGDPWCAYARKTIYPLSAGAVCVAELDFAPDPEKTVCEPTVRRMSPGQWRQKASVTIGAQTQFA